MAFDTRELSEVRSSPRSSVGALIKFPGGSIIGSFLSIAILCTLATLSAKANDSTVELATGGLAFVKNNNIEMLSENLFISADEIRVRYRDPPPLKWSDLRYVFDIQEDCNGKEAIQA